MLSISITLCQVACLIPFDSFCLSSFTIFSFFTTNLLGLRGFLAVLDMNLKLFTEVLNCVKLCRPLHYLENHQMTQGLELGNFETETADEDCITLDLLILYRVFNLSALKLIHSPNVGLEIRNNQLGLLSF